MALPARVEVAIIGAGITGLALALRCVAEGLSTVVLERDRPGAGASGRNAGFLLAGVAENYAAAARRHGRGRAAEIWRFTLANHDRLVRLVAGMDVGYRRGGSWVLPATTAEAEDLVAAASMLAEDGLTGEWRSDAPASGEPVAGGLLNPADGEVDPARLLHALGSGIPPDVVVTGVSVEMIDPGAGGVRLATSRGEVLAERTVVATNGYTARLLPGLPLRPVRAQMLATAPERLAVCDRPVYSDLGFRYWRQLVDGRVLVGGFRNSELDAEVGDDDRPSESMQRRLEAHARRLGVTAPVTHRWAGTMAFTPDELPLVGAVSGHPGVHACGGYSGHGLGFAVSCAEVLVDSWEGKQLPSWLDVRRFAASEGFGRVG